MDQPQTCHGCGFLISNLLRPVERYGGRIPRFFIYAETSRGEIAVCDLCFDSEVGFRELNENDKAVVRWHFGCAFADEDGDPARAIEILLPLLAESRVPDILSPLGRAFLLFGRREEGIALLQESLEYRGSPYRKVDEELLRRA